MKVYQFAAGRGSAPGADCAPPLDGTFVRLREANPEERNPARLHPHRGQRPLFPGRSVRPHPEMGAGPQPPKPPERAKRQAERDCGAGGEAAGCERGIGGVEGEIRARMRREIHASLKIISFDC